MCLTCNAELWAGNRKFVSAHHFAEDTVTVRCGAPAIQVGQLVLCYDHALCEMERLIAVAKQKRSDADRCDEIAESIRKTLQAVALR